MVVIFLCYFFGSLLQSAHSETCERCNQLQRQITQLKRQLLKVKTEKDEAVKLKEEVNKCNLTITTVELTSLIWPALN